MTFLAPERLLLLLGVAALAAAYAALQLNRRHHADRFTNPAWIDTVAPSRPGWKRHAVAGASVLALGALVVGLARPSRAERVPRQEAVVMLAIDVSASMRADDVSPTRLGAAITAAERFVADIPDRFQVGLIAFDSQARVMATPTRDHQSVIDAIASLEPGEGTAAGEGIYSALDSIKAAEADPHGGAARLPATIVLLSDGATTTGRPLHGAAAAARAAKVPVSTIAFGTDTGVVVIRGQVIPVPSDKPAMADAADTSGGKYFEAASASQLRKVYDDIQGRVGYTTQQREVSRGFLGFALVIVFAAAGASLLWTGRYL